MNSLNCVKQWQSMNIKTRTLTFHLEESGYPKGHPATAVAGDISFHRDTYYSRTENREIPEEFEDAMKLVGFRYGGSRSGWTGAFFRSESTNVRHYITMRELDEVIPKMENGILKGKFKHRKQGTVQMISLVDD